MSRNTKHEVYRPSPQIYTKREMGQFMAREVRRRLISAGIIPHPSTLPPKNVYRWALPHTDVNGELLANTKSDARGEIKKILGLGKKDKLPAGITIEKVGPYADQLTSPATSEAAQIRGESLATIFEHMALAVGEMGVAASQFSLGYQKPDDEVFEGDLVPVIILALQPATLPRPVAPPPEQTP